MKQTKRSPGMTQISITVPVDLLGVVDRLVESDDTDRSKYFRRLMRRDVKRRAPAAAQPVTTEAGV